MTVDCQDGGVGVLVVDAVNATVCLRGVTVVNARPNTATRGVADGAIAVYSGTNSSHVGTGSSSRGSGIIGSGYDDSHRDRDTSVSSDKATFVSDATVVALTDVAIVNSSGLTIAASDVRSATLSIRNCSFVGNAGGLLRQQR